MTLEDYPEWLQERVKEKARKWGMSLGDYCSNFHIAMPSGMTAHGEQPINLKGGRNYEFIRKNKT